MITKQSIYSALGLSRQQYHQYRRRRLRLEQLYDEAERALLLARADHPGLGLTKAWYQLRPAVGRNRFIDEMTHRGHALRLKRSYKRTTRSGGYRFPNLIKGLIINNINLIWQSDTTYYRIADRFFFLTFIVDLYSRRIVGYCVSDSLSAEANLTALKMAIRQRANDDLEGLIFHSDGGTQYRFGPLIELLRNKGMSSSMCQTALDNAYAERLNGTVKNEYLQLQQPSNLKRLAKLTTRAVDNYNNERIHYGLPIKVSPRQFEAHIRQDPQRWKYWLCIKDGTSTEQSTKIFAGQMLNTSGMWAPKGVAQILPANVILHQSMVQTQLLLKLE